MVLSVSCLGIVTNGGVFRFLRANCLLSLGFIFSVADDSSE